MSYRNNLPAGYTVVSGQAWLQAPDGTWTTIYTGAIGVNGPNLTILVGPFTQLGDYVLDVLATLDGSLPHPALPYRVGFTVEYSDDGT